MKRINRAVVATVSGCGGSNQLAYDTATNLYCNACAVGKRAWRPWAARFLWMCA